MKLPIPPLLLVATLRWRSVLAAVGSVVLVTPHVKANAAPTLANVDSSLQRLATRARQSFPETDTPGVHSTIVWVAESDKKTMPARFDASDRVLVHIHLDGRSTPEEVARQIAYLRGRVLATNSDYRHGVIAAYIPTDQIGNSSALAGVRAITLEHRPELRVGKYTSQGAAVLHTDVLNQHGVNGQGVTVGVLSDSFDTASQVTASPPATTAAQDVASGDLPVVNVLEDYPQGTDEGRAMCQIVYDEAPRCKLAFATGEESEVDFANNILALRTQAGASVIVDDIGYLDEPVFSDGLIAQAVNKVARNKTLPGKPAIYLSAAGNDGNNSYRGSYRNLPDAEVRKAGNHGNLKLNASPKSANYLDPSLTAGGWYNWNQARGVEPSTSVEAPGPTTYPYAIFFQWDDPFDEAHGITTSYNFLVFDQNGNYLPDLSSTTNAFGTQEPLQAIGYLALGTKYQIAITKIKQTDPQAGPIPFAHQLALYTTLDGASTLLGPYFHPAPLDVPNLYGHAAAGGAIAVAAYDFSWRPTLPYAPELENFTSPGPVSIYFDQNDNRLARPEIRLKPEVAGVDGVVTTFFGSGYYNFPYSFFGTSAAAPSVAGVAALMVQHAGGPGSLTPDDAREALIDSTLPHNSTVERTQAVGVDSSSAVSVTALGQWYFGPNYFTVKFVGARGDSLDQITIDGTASQLTFDTTQFELGALNGVAAKNVTVVQAAPGSSSFTLKFKKGSFVSGESVSFTVEQDVAGTFSGYTQDDYGVGVEAEDLAFGSTFTAQFASQNHANLIAPFQYGFLNYDFSPPDGYGLIDARAAVDAVSP